MKTILMIAALTLAGLTSFSQKKQFSYVITKTDTVYATNVEPGYFNTRVELANGENLKIDNQDINLVFANGETFEKLPVYINNHSTGELAMMKLVDFQNGIKIYKYENFNGAKDCLDAVFTFYSNGQYLTSKTNPSLAEIVNFVAGYNQPDQMMQQEKQLVVK